MVEIDPGAFDNRSFKRTVELAANQEAVFASPI